MRNLFLSNAMIYSGGHFEYGSLRAVDGMIAGFGDISPDSSDVVYDAGGKMLVPGFIDIHTHGAYGVDVNHADIDGLNRISTFFASHGTTGWLCSILSDNEMQTEKCIGLALDAMKRLEGAELLGIHLEGPFLSPDYAGAMPEEMLKAGSISLFRKYQDAAKGAVRYITVSPEVEGILKLVREISGETAVAIGHSGANYDQAMKCIGWGAKAATHTFNAMRLFHQHEPAVMGAALESDIYCEVICDGYHVHPGAVRLLLKTKGLDKVVAVTDSVMAAGLPDGEYMLGVNDIVVKDGDAKIKYGGARAGSTLTMDRALLNLMSFTGEPIERILPLLTENPAKLIGEDKKRGAIKTGLYADLVLLDRDFNVCDTFVRGRRVYSNAFILDRGGDNNYAINTYEANFRSDGQI